MDLTKRFQNLLKIRIKVEVCIIANTAHELSLFQLYLSPFVNIVKSTKLADVCSVSALLGISMFIFNCAHF